MKQGILFLVCAIGLVAGRPASAQDAAFADDMRFLNALRARGDHDLALALLQRLTKNAPPQVATELALESAKTRLGVAADEPDSTKRMGIYQQVRGDFELFLTKNPDHARAAEVQLDIARVVLLVGRTQLSRAMLQDTPEGRASEGDRARATLEEAGQKLEAVAKLLDAKLESLKEPKTPAETAQKKRLEEQRQYADLEIGVNIFDQARTYSERSKSNEILKLRGQKVLDAAKVLEKVGGGDQNSPVYWQAQAWLGRCIDESGEPKKARAKFTEILQSDAIAARDGQRLARYFRLLVILEEKDMDPPWVTAIEESANRWIRDYPRYLRSPEGYGVRFVLAQVLLEKAEKAGLKPEVKTAALTGARKLLREVEQEENEYSDQAKRLKIGVIAKQGGFTKKITDLKSFEDCYVRAQFESIQMAEDANKIKDEKELEKKRNERIDTILTVLDLGLKQPDAKGKASPEINTARQLITQYSFYLKKYDMVIKSGEAFARNDPRSGHAAMAAAYALQAYAQVIAEHEAPLDGTAELKDEKGQKIDDEAYLAKVAEERKKMQDFAVYCLERWPKEIAGDLARHQMALTLTRKRKAREKQISDEERVKNLQEAIKILSAITPTYASYVIAQSLLAEKALQAEKENLPAIPDGQTPPTSYRQRALAALKSIPDVVGDDPAVNQSYLLAKAQLAEELYKDKKYVEMDQAIKPALEKVATIPLSEDKKRDKEVRDYFVNRLTTVSLFSRYGLAEAEFQAGKHDKVLAVLNPLVDQVKDDKLPQIKSNVQLGNALLSMALRSCIQSGQLDRARVVVEAYQKMNSEEAGGVPQILRILVGLIDKQISDYKEKKDQEGMKKANLAFAAILADLLAKQKDKSPTFKLTLAQCYSSMGKYEDAVLLLESVPLPKAEAGAVEPDAEAMKVYKGCKLMYLRMLRLDKKLDKCRKEITPILEKDKGWGAKDIAVKKENLYLLMDEGKFVEAYIEANTLVKALAKRADTDNAMKDHYLECYYLMVSSLVEYGKKKDAMKKEKSFKDAATLMEQLEKKFPDFGNEATKKRFMELLNSNPELKTEHDKLKMLAK